MCFLLVAASALASCGGGSSKTTPSSTQSSPTTTATTTAAEAPGGHLSSAEYDSIHAMLLVFRKLDGAKDAAATVRVVRPACRTLASAPRTELMDATRSECAQILRFLTVAGRFVTGKAECTRAAQAGDISCFAVLYRSLAGASRVLAVRGAALNARLRDRKLPAACAREIGDSRRELRAYKTLSRDAHGAALALEARDQARLQRAVAAISGDFNNANAADKSPITAPSRFARACKPS
jgi:hypothetical protein